MQMWQQIYKYERYVPFVGWNSSNLGANEKKYVERVWAGGEGKSGDTFQDTESPIPPNYVVHKDWAPTRIPDGDPDGWTYARDYNAEHWEDQNTTFDVVRRVLYERIVVHENYEEDHRALIASRR